MDRRNYIGILFMLFLLAGLPPLASPAATIDGTEKGNASPFSQTKFVPDISLIADFSLFYRNIADNENSILTVPGMAPNTDAWSRNESIRGFNLNYAELAIASIVDPFFDLSAIFHFSGGAAEIEEAFVRTRSLPWGLQMKAGKFLSDFGRINSQHEHYWNFNERPLVCQAFFGGEGLNEKGLQINWVAPLPFFLKLGLEILQGENNSSFGTQGFAGAAAAPFPNLRIGFTKASVDIGRLTLLGGFSLAAGGTRISGLQDLPETVAYSGNTCIWGIDLLLKYPIDSYRYLSLQSEYMDRRFNGQSHGAELADSATGQAGLYVELIWRFDLRFKCGARFDDMVRNDEQVDGIPIALPADMQRWTLGIDFLPSEFSRFRLQAGRDLTHYLGGERRPFYEISLSLNMAVGAHGAHSF